jgi:phosphoglycolate phosphatase
MQSVIWDWNGTLLNDLDFCISTINILLKKRNLGLLNRAAYKEVFSFPVKDYYAAIGFDFSKEDFSIPAREFIDLYNNGVKACYLHKSAIDVLSFFKRKGIRQFVLSAMKQEMLEETLKHNSIHPFFEGIFGLNDHYAVSKIDRGKQLLSEYNIDKSSTWIIGDTTHDYEVAQKLGIKCVLIADGHQTEERLRNTGVNILSELKELKVFQF